MTLFQKYMLSSVLRSPDDVAAAIEVVAEVASDAVAAAEDVAAHAIEHATEKMERAEELADEVMEAALLTELGKQVSHCLERAEAWHGELIQKVETQAIQILSLENQVAELSAQVAAQQPQVIVTPAQSSPELLTPQVSEVLETMEAQIVTPAQAVVPNAPISDVAPPRKRTRLI